MPTGNKLRNRLTLWSFILLFLFLGVGGFFCYYAQQRAVLSHFDKQLLAIASNFACNYRDVTSSTAAQNDFCNDFKRLAIHQAGEQAVTLYATTGKPLCSSPHPLNQFFDLNQTSLTHSAAGRAYFETLDRDDSGQVRRLTFPIIANDQVRYHLQLVQSLDLVKSSLSSYTLALISAGIFIAVGLSICQWLLLGIIFDPLKKLSLQMDTTGEENLTERFVPPMIGGAEMQQLADSYNSLTDRINLTIQRSRQFATDVTHELRTPLTILRGETELAFRGDKTADELKQILTSNLEELSSMGHLVDDLLLLSKSELGEIPLKLEALNLNGLLEELHFHGTIIAEPKNISVELKGPDKQVSILADVNRIRQVFLNLMTNGIKYTPEGGRVTIDWTIQQETARIIFQDTGIGIDSEHQQNIFDRFYRINKTGNRNDGGSGLGLAIAKWLVEAHGGSIMVCSVPGEGSSFAVQLPLTRKLENPSEAASSAL